MSVSVGNRRHDWLPKLLLLRAYLAFGHQVTTKTAFLSLQQKGQSMTTILPDRRHREEFCGLFTSWFNSQKEFCLFPLMQVILHLTGAHLTDVADVKNSSIRIERDYLKHLKRKFGAAVTRFILINKLNGFKYPVNITLDLKHSSFLYLCLHIFCTVVILVVVKAKY